MHSVFEKSKDTYEKQKQAFGVLGTMDTNEGAAYPDRVNYNRLGEDLRKTFRAEFAKTHRGETFSDLAKEMNEEKARAMVFVKGQSTQKVNKKLGDGCLEKIAQYWTNNGQQQNISRVQIYHDINKGHKLSKIARYIHLQVYNSTKNVSGHFSPDM